MSTAPDRPPEGRPAPASAPHSRALLDRQRGVLEMVVRGEPLPLVLAELCRIVEDEASDEVVAAVLLVEDGHLRHGAAPGLPDEYNAAVDGLAVSPDLGTCSAAAARNTIIVTPDIAADPRWEGIARLPLGLGLPAAWSMPITGSDGAVIGTFGTYFRARRVPTQLEIDLVGTLARTAALAIERSRSDEALQVREAQLAFLSRLALALQPLSESADIVGTAARLLAEQLGADRCVYAASDGDDHLWVVGGHSNGVPPVSGRWPLDGFGERFETAMRAGRSYLVHDSEADLDVDPRIRDAFAQTRVRASITVPLMRDGALTAVASVQQTVPRHWKSHEVALAEQVVARCWEALERARVAGELRVSEARYRAMVQASPECVKVVAPDGTVLQMNAAGLRMVEAPGPEAVVGKCVYDLIAPEHRDAFRAFNERVCAGEGGALEFELVGLGGKRRWMETNAVPLPWSTGGHAHLAVTRDVSERVQSERSLSDSRARLDYAVRLSGIGFWYCDLPFDELIWDARVREHFFLEPDTRVTIETFYERIHPEDREPTREAIERAIASHAAYDVYYRTVAPDGSAFKWIRALGGSAYADDGSPIRFDGVTVDVTEVKLTQARLAALLDREREQARLLGEVARAARTIYASTTVESVLAVITEEARRIIGAHQAVVSLTTGADWSQAIVNVSMSDKYARYAGYDAAPNGAGIYTVVCETNRPMRLTQAEMEAHPRWKRFSGSAGHPPLRGWLAVPLVAHDGRNIGLVQLSDRLEGDFTETDEAVLVQLAQIGSVALENSRLYEKLRDQDKRKDEFIATLAHELRNPLAPIRTGLSLVSRGGDPVELRRTLAMMERQITHLVRLVDDLLDVSRITHGKLVLARAPCDVRDVVQSAVETSMPVVQSFGHRLDIAMDDRPMVVDADATRLSQVLSNLVNNAAKYTPRSGEIHVSARVEDGEVELRVQDNGMGIPAAMVGRVFDLFTQVDRPEDGHQAGLGIGLTLVRRLVELHGGTVHAESDGPGRGSTFVVRLPLLAGWAESPHARALPSTAAAGSFRILVVDDNRDAADTLRMLLEMEGHDVRMVHDGPAAVEAAAAFVPEVVFLDIGLPGMDGFQVAAHLREAGRPMHLFAVTGWGAEDDRRRARESGFDDHLVKPVDTGRLLELLAAIEPRAVAVARDAD
ncbi:hypothetical protein GCM10028862_01540 [Luteimonas pelagia]